MIVKYRVLGLDPSEHSLVVRYFTDTMSEFDLATEFTSDGKVRLTANGYPTRCRTDSNLTVYNTEDVSSDAIKSLIMNSAPVQWFFMQEQIKNPNVDTTLSSVETLVGEITSFEYDTSHFKV